MSVAALGDSVVKAVFFYSWQLQQWNFTNYQLSLSGDPV
jgi:hypothetical protein